MTKLFSVQGKRDDADAADQSNTIQYVAFSGDTKKHKRYINIYIKLDY